MAEKREIPEIIVMASGNGSTFEAIARAARDRVIEARISLLICNRRGAKVIERAERFNIRHLLIESKGDELFESILKGLDGQNPDLIVLAGFTRILPDYIIEKYEGRMINTHPSLLPCFGGKGFYGDHVHKAVLESGARVSGCSVHFVTTDVDGGPIIAQEPVPVLDTDDYISLGERVHEAELGLLVRAIARVLTTKHSISGKRVLFSD